MKQTIILLSVISAVTFSCNASKEAMNTDTSLYDTKWSLKKIHSGDQSQGVATKAFIRFDKEKGSAGGNGSCNGFGSNFTVENDKLSFKNIFSTKMYCEAVQTIENKFFQGLQTANRFEVKEKSLFIYNDKQLLLEFSAE
jgi:heat shock protein HslJ